jgi:hypothetical protein
MKNNNWDPQTFVQQLGLRIGLMLGAIFALSLLTNSTARAQSYTFSTLAGNGATLDHTDGTGSNARFFNPTGVAIDSSGTIYVADGGDHTVRKITAGGVVTTFAGASGLAGSADGAGGNARFVYPFAVAVDTSGNVYVTDVGDHTVRRITPGGLVVTIAGTAGVSGSADGVGTAALFNYPEGVAADAVGNVYVSDTGNSTIRKIAVNGTVTTFAGAAGQNGTADGTGSGARFNYQAGLAIDTAGNLYVADQGNSAVRKINSGGVVTTLAGSGGNSGSADGVGGNARFDHPTSVAVDGAGDVYVADTSNQLIRKISVSTNTVTTLSGRAGTGGNADGAGTVARFFYPFGITVTSGGSIYVADTGNHTIRAVSAAGAVGTLAGAVGVAGAVDGTGTGASFAYPGGLAVDTAGNVYVADHNNHTVRKVTASGTVTTLAGAAGIPGSADGVGAAARFNGLTGVAVDVNGTVYVADAGSSTIRKISAGGVVTTFAGLAGVAGSSDGVGSAARFNAPQGIAVDGAGVVYVADTNNSTIRKITTDGTVTTLSGAAGQNGSGDGAVGSARFNGPYALTVDTFGNVYVADFSNGTIRKITAGGVVSTLAGVAGKVGYLDATGVQARFNQTYAIAVDANSNVYVADTNNRAIRKITSLGVVTTVNGGGGARFYYPQGLAIDSGGNLYIADGDNQTITKGTVVAPPPTGTAIASQSTTVGGSATFSFGTGNAQTNYRWQISTDSGTTWTSLSDTATYSGTGTTTLTISNAPATLSGAMFRVALTNLAGNSTSGSATLTVTSTTPPPASSGARLINMSVRTQVGTNADAVFVGFAINGSGSKQMVIRGIGPTLTSFNVPGALATPELTLYNSTNVALATNSGWGGSATMSSAFSAVGAFALPPRPLTPRSCAPSRPAPTARRSTGSTTPPASASRSSTMPTTAPPPPRGSTIFPHARRCPTA